MRAFKRAGEKHRPERINTEGGLPANLPEKPMSCGRSSGTENGIDSEIMAPDKAKLYHCRKKETEQRKTGKTSERTAQKEPGSALFN